MSKLSQHNPRKSLTSILITDGLGYCCEAGFWEKFEDITTEYISLRLGVAERTVQEHRKRFRDGEVECTGCLNCLKGKGLLP